MPSKDNGMNRDELDAISAEELLKKLRGEMAGARSGASDEIKPQEASHISDEASKKAQDSIIHGDPEEFADNLESLMRMVMNMPSDKPETTKAEEDMSEAEEYTEEAEDIDRADTAVFDPAELESVEEGMAEAVIEEDAVSGEDAAEEAFEETADDIEAANDAPWYSEDDELLYKQATAEMDQPNEEQSQEPAPEADEEKGFLSDIVRLVNEETAHDPIPEDDEFDFVTDEVPAEETDDTYTDDGVEPDEDGGREYKDIGTDEFNSTEMSLLKLFGGEETLTEAYGKEKLDEIIESANQAFAPNTPVKKKFYEIFPSDYEYTEPSQKEEIKKRYTFAFRGAVIRFALAAVFAIALFIFENLKVFGATVPSLINISVYPTVFAMIDLQLVLLCALAAFKQVSYGAISLVKLKPEKQSIATVLTAASIVYTATVSASSGIRGGVLYNFPVALALALSVLGEIMDIKRQMMGFNIVSSSNKKYAVRHITDAERELDAKEFTEYVLEDSGMFAVAKTGFVDGFFAHMNKKPENNKFTGILLIINAATALLAAALGIIGGKDVYTVATMAFGTLVLGLGATAVFSSTHSLYRANKTAYDHGCAILGESSLDEYSDGSVIFFDDKDIFPATGVRISSIKVYGDNRIDSVIYNAASLFTKMGGPLNHVFDLATVDIGQSDDVSILAIEEKGINCTVDSRELYFGSNDYMISKGFETPYGENDANMEKSGIRLMFMADENEILAKIIVQYNIDFEYEIILKQLYKAGMCVGVRTQDPNIDREFIMKKLKLKKDYPIKVVRMAPDREVIRSVERTNCGVVSTSKVKSLLKALSLCDKIKYVSKIHNLLLTVSAVMALILVYVVTAFGKLNFGSVYAMLYQLFWLIPMTLVTLFAE